MPLDGCSTCQDYEEVSSRRGGSRRGKGAAAGKKAGAGRRSGGNKGRRKGGKEEEESEGICDSEDESEEDDEEEEVGTDENENAFRRGCGNPSRLGHTDHRFPLDDLRKSFRVDISLVAHVTWRDAYALHGLGDVSWVGSVLHR